MDDVNKTIIWRESTMDDVNKMIRLAVENAEVTKRIIRIKGGDRHEAWRETQRALIEAKCPVFVRGNCLVEPHWRWEKADGDRKVLALSLMPYDVLRLSDVVARDAGASFLKFDNRRRKDDKWFPIDPPGDVIETLLGRGFWDFATIVGVISTPTMRPDGSLLTAPGYDPATRLWYKSATDVELPPVPEEPSRDDAEKALKLLTDLLAGFPFVGDVDKAVAVAAILTVVLRGAFATAPLILFNKPEPGTGATYLKNVIASIGTGQPAIPLLTTGDNKELTNELSAAAIEAKPILDLNNLKFDLDNAMLSQMVTEGIIEIRPFHHNDKTIKCDCRAMTVLANGNNVRVVGELVRRTITGRLDARTERPELRRFGFDPVEWVSQDRGRYLAAVFTIARAYIAAGSPPQKDATAVAGFEGWSGKVQQPLVWLGCADPRKSQDSARDMDPDRASLRQRIGALVGAFGANEFTAADIAQVATEGNDRIPPQPNLREAYNNRDGKISAKSVGWQMKRDIDRVVDNRKVERVGSNVNGGIYKVANMVAEELLL
jgi:putative DNA primase/helicase